MGTTFSQEKKETVEPTCSDQKTNVVEEEVDSSKIKVASLPKYVEIDLGDSDDITNSTSNDKCTETTDTKVNKCTRSDPEQFGEEEFNYYEHFIKYGAESDITPQGYAEFAIKKIGTLKCKEICLTEEQTTKLQGLIDNPSTVENDFKVLCQILSKEQFGYIGW
tara:strand:- start:93 stop:584 length:492 start_codon:yes stop_codon:yes gene_type:complete